MNVPLISERCSLHETHGYREYLRKGSITEGDTKIHGYPSSKEEEDAAERKNLLYCAVCFSAVTEDGERISLEGSHEHTFVNPLGVSFHIGCFRDAPGCTPLGNGTEEWTWFRGFSWEIVICSNCRTHLGWFYLSRGGDSFFGLILEQLKAG